jgi:hypothetical protein
MASMQSHKASLPFKSIGRLKLTLTIAMLGFITDTVMTNWMLGLQNGYYESNPNLYPELGVPLMVLTFVVFDFIIPRKVIFDNIFYTLSILQWSGPFQNLLVLLNITQGINFFYALPFILITSFAVIHFKVNRNKLPIGSINKM